MVPLLRSAGSGVVIPAGQTRAAAPTADHAPGGLECRSSNHGNGRARHAVQLTAERATAFSRCPRHRAPMIARQTREGCTPGSPQPSRPSSPRPSMATAPTRIPRPGCCGIAGSGHRAARAYPRGTPRRPVRPALVDPGGPLVAGRVLSGALVPLLPNLAGLPVLAAALGIAAVALGASEQATPCSQACQGGQSDGRAPQSTPGMIDLGAVGVRGNPVHHQRIFGTRRAQDTNGSGMLAAVRRPASRRR
jgi:hypothetical protein